MHGSRRQSLRFLRVVTASRSAGCRRLNVGLLRLDWHHHFFAYYEKPRRIEQLRVELFFLVVTVVVIAGLQRCPRLSIENYVKWQLGKQVYLQRQKVCVPSVFSNLVFFRPRSSRRVHNQDHNNKHNSCLRMVILASKKVSQISESMISSTLDKVHNTIDVCRRSIPGRTGTKLSTPPVNQASKYTTRIAINLPIRQKNIFLFRLW